MTAGQPRPTTPTASPPAARKRTVTFTPEIPPAGTTKGSPLDEALARLRHAQEAVEILRPFHGGANGVFTVDSMSIDPAPIQPLADELRFTLESTVASVAADIRSALDYAAKAIYESHCRGKLPQPRLPRKRTPTASNESLIYWPYRKAGESDDQFDDRVDLHFPGLRDDPSRTTQMLFETIRGSGQFSPGFTHDLPPVFRIANMGKHEGLPRICYAEVGPKVDVGSGPVRAVSVKVLSIEGGPTYIYPHLSRLAQNAELAVSKIKELLGEGDGLTAYYERHHPEAAARMRAMRSVVRRPPAPKSGSGPGDGQAT